ncbi:MAG: hypothetical protein KKH98_08930 [Spirochaetes bacterium]|nr:hypothetical protein [Spirochaetota bacterium]
MKRSYQIGLLGVIVLLLNISSSFARIKVTPAVQQMVLTAGEEREVFFEIMNSGQQDLKITIEPEDWGQTQDLKDITWTRWLDLDTRGFQLKAGEKKRISCRVHLPSDITREVNAMVYFSCELPRKNIRLKTRVGVSLFAGRKGNEKKNIEIESIKVSKSSGLNPACYFDITLKNNGNTHIIPQGYLILSKPDNTRVAYLPLSNMEPVIADEKKVYRITCKESTFNGNYKGKMIITYKGFPERAEFKKVKEFSFFISRKEEKRGKAYFKE